jgi:hypothetical protein
MLHQDKSCTCEEELHKETEIQRIEARDKGVKITLALAFYKA